MAFSSNKKKVLSPEVTEPPRENIYDIILKNLELSKRKTFIHRVMYIGEHFTKDTGTNLPNFFEGVVQETNKLEVEEQLTGFFLLYPNYFVHVLDGEEDAIYKHFEILLKKAKDKIKLGKMKIIMWDFHIAQRFYTYWTSLSTSPTTYVDQLDGDQDITKIMGHARLIVKKMYNVINHHKLQVESDLTNEGEGKSRTEQSQSIRASMVTLGKKQPVIIHLPPNELLELLLNSEVLPTIQEDLKKYNNRDFDEFFKDEEWPLTDDFIMTDIFDKPYETITELSLRKSIAEKKD